MFIFSSSEWDIQTAETPPIPLWRGSVFAAYRRAVWMSPPIRELHLKYTEFDYIFRNYSDCKSICPEGVTVLFTVVLFIRLYYFCFFFSCNPTFPVNNNKKCFVNVPKLWKTIKIIKDQTTLKEHIIDVNRRTFVCNFAKVLGISVFTYRLTFL